ncbi:MAG TPA: ester cyclase [Gemmatimonadaceae bacterium]|nr:ester cyclase [Gemmatimonadaceae bacterium]
MEYQRIWIEGLNHGDASAADAAFVPDCIVHITGVPEPFRGVVPWKEFIAGFLRAFPDLPFTIEDQLVQGALVAFRWRATGTHMGPLARSLRRASESQSTG